MDFKHIIKIQALWRGFMSRKGKIVPCACCGHPMTITPKEYPETMSAAFIHTCAWCAAEKSFNCLECKMGMVVFCPGCGSDDCNGHCRTDLGPCGCSYCTKACDTCGSGDCSGDCEPYIACCMCGDNCYDGDYPSWRFCSRRCMVDASRGY